jgi:branched-chain amino acid transport system substrate-binding protein
VLYLLAAPAGIKIGEIDLISGAIGQYGTTGHRSVALAVGDANAQGGVLGQRVQLITEDNQSPPGQAATIARKFVTQDKVLAIMADLTSSATLEAAPIAQQAGVPLVTPTATNPKMTQRCVISFSVTAWCTATIIIPQRVASAENVTESLIVVDQRVGLSRFFGDALSQGGGAVVKTQSYSSGDTDFHAQLTALRAAHPDTVLLPGCYPEVGLILR